MSADILRELARVKVEFQLRTIGLVLGLRDRDAIHEDASSRLSPEGVAARAEGIAQ